MNNPGKYDLSKVINEINTVSTAKAKSLAEGNAPSSKAGVIFTSYFSFISGLFSMSNNSSPQIFRGVEKMLRTLLTGLKLLKLQNKI